MAKIVTITNPLTGQPAQVDQLDHTAQQIDDGLNIARGVSNSNLLDNWYFGNPVDQRGGYVVIPGTAYYVPGTWDTADGTTTNYVKVDRFFVDDTGTYPIIIVNGADRVCNRGTAVRGYTGAGYGIDRWYGEGILIESNGLTLTAQGKYIFQNLDDKLKKALDGKTVTVSALLSTGELLFGTKVYAAAPSANEYFVSGTIHIVNITSGGIMFWANQKATIAAVKLELGSQQTLAHQDENGNWVLNEIPDYGEQLARCQRYSEKFLFCNGESSSPVGVRFQNAIGKDADLVTIGAYIYFATQKRTVPVVRIEYDIADGPTQTATVNWVDERCFSSTNIIVPAGQFIDIHWYEAIADL